MNECLFPIDAMQHAGRGPDGPLPLLNNVVRLHSQTLGQAGQNVASITLEMRL